MHKTYSIVLVVIIITIICLYLYLLRIGKGTAIRNVDSVIISADYEFSGKHTDCGGMKISTLSSDDIFPVHVYTQRLYHKDEVYFLERRLTSICGGKGTTKESKEARLSPTERESNQADRAKLNDLNANAAFLCQGNYTHILLLSIFKIALL